MHPGGLIASLANLLRGAIMRMGLSIWGDPGGPGSGQSFTMAGTVDKDGNRRSKWWAMKGYADLTGTYRQVTAGAGFDGLAALGSRPSAGSSAKTNS
jgi:hypothetical protein